MGEHIGIQGFSAIPTPAGPGLATVSTPGVRPAPAQTTMTMVLSPAPGGDAGLNFKLQGQEFFRQQGVEHPQ